MQPKRYYIALAADSTRHDTIAFSVYAENPAKVRRLVEDFYLSMDWHPLPSSIEVRSERASEQKPVVFLGHAQEEYQMLDEQARAFASRLLDTVDDPLDEVYRYVAQFPVGRQVIISRYPDHPYVKERR